MEIPKFSPFDILVTALAVIYRATDFRVDDKSLDKMVKRAESTVYLRRGMRLPPEDIALAKSIANEVAKSASELDGDWLAASANELTNEQITDVLKDFHDRIRKAGGVSE